MRLVTTIACRGRGPIRRRQHLIAVAAVHVGRGNDFRQIKFGRRRGPAHGPSPCRLGRPDRKSRDRRIHAAHGGTSARLAGKGRLPNPQCLTHNTDAECG